MAKNDRFFKILFAFQIALLPMVIFAYLFMPLWAMGLFIAGILLVKIWLELYKNKISFAHTVIDSIGSILTFGTLLILFAVTGLLSKPLTIISLVFIVLFNLLILALFNHNMPEFIDAVDYCYMLFECLTLASFVVLTFNYPTIANIGLFAILLTTLVSVCYKIYYSVRYTKINDIFRRKK